MITKSNLLSKRVFDLILSILLTPILISPIVILVIMATIDTRKFGLFKQERIGQHATKFYIYKIRTLRCGEHNLINMDDFATIFGKFLRSSKLDELPQLFNVILGQMSFIGPRPDIKGFADELMGEDRVILKVKPGITGPATIKYKNEEEILARQRDPETYNRTIIWEDKVKINKNYVQNWSFYLDLKYIIRSIIN